MLTAFLDRPYAWEQLANTKWTLFCFGVLWTTVLFFGEKGGREMGIIELGE